VFYLFAQRI